MSLDLFTEGHLGVRKSVEGKKKKGGDGVANIDVS